MAKFTFGKEVDIHWNGYEIVGPALTEFSIPDQLYEEFEGDFREIEPSLTWIDTNEFATLSASVSAATLSATAPIALTSTSTGRIISFSSGTASNGYLSSTDWNTFNNKQSTSAPVTYTANFSVAATDLWIINNKSGSSCTATLPAAASYSGRVLHFQNYQAQTLVSASSNVVPLAGGAATTSILLASAGDSATLVSDGANWLMTQYVPNNILLLE